MTVELNHTIVRSHDRAESAAFLAGILGKETGDVWGPFVPLVLDNGAVLEFLEVGAEPVSSQHYAFLVGDAEFDAGFARVRELGIDYWADPFQQRSGAINHSYGGRGVYFLDPSGHIMELMTVPYGDTPQ